MQNEENVNQDTNLEEDQDLNLENESEEQEEMVKKEAYENQKML